VDEGSFSISTGVPANHFPMIESFHVVEDERLATAGGQARNCALEILLLGVVDFLSDMM